MQDTFLRAVAAGVLGSGSKRNTSYRPNAFGNKLLTGDVQA
jgi:hypothetical protein